MSFEIPIELKKAIRDNRLIVFAGAGLSYDLVNIKEQPLKGWGNLVEQILIHLKDTGHDVDLLIPLLKKYDPIRILDLIEADINLTKKEIYDFAKDFLDLHPDKNDFSLHQKLTQLSRKIITTNYDIAFETASPELRKRVAYIGKAHEFSILRDQNTPLLFKLHGCFLDSASMVLFPSNYVKLYNSQQTNSEHARSVLRNIIHNNVVLFVGSGMGDYQINTLFREIKNLQGEFNQKHFVITNKTLDSSLDFLSLIPIKTHAEIHGIFDILVEFKKNNSEDSEKERLRQELFSAQEEIKTLRSKQNSTQQEFVDRAAIEYFSAGLEFQLIDNFESAIYKYEMAIGLMPKLHVALNNLGLSLGGLAKSKEGKEKEKLFLQAFDKYSAAIEIKPDKHEAFYNWGSDLAEFAKSKEGEEKEKLFLQAFDKYSAAIEIKPDQHKAFNNWGNSLAEFAQSKEGEEKEKLFLQAFDKYRAAIEIKPDKHEAFYNWGSDLAEFAKSKEGEEKEKLFLQAFDKYSAAIEIKPDQHKAFNNWGNSLAEFAQSKEGEEKEKLFLQAFDKYRAAIEIKPDKHEAFHNWGSDLAEFAKSKEGEEKEKLFLQAFDKLNKAMELGGSKYNLACIYMLEKNTRTAFLILDESLTAKEITPDFVLKDPDWKDALDNPDFKAIISKHQKD